MERSGDMYNYKKSDRTGLYLGIHSGDNSYKDRMVKIMNNYDVKVDQWSHLLDVPKEVIHSIFGDEDLHLSDKEINTIEHRLIFLEEGFSIMNSMDRIRLLIQSILVEEYKFSVESLSKYAEVPVEILIKFLSGKDNIEKNDLVHICVNLQMLVNILKSKV